MEQSPENRLWLCLARRTMFIGSQVHLAGLLFISLLSDGWAELSKAFEDVRAFAKEETTEEETQIVNQLIDSISRVAG